MAINREPFFVNPLFYDALSGEFTPPTDDKQRQHTLGRLAYASYSKGELTVEDTSPPYLRSLYIPSWAGHVTVRADFDFDEKGFQPTTLTGILLQDKAKRSLCVAEDGSIIYIGTVDNGDTRLPLELGEELQTARAAVTQAAQEFFDTAVLL